MTVLWSLILTVLCFHSMPIKSHYISVACVVGIIAGFCIGPGKTSTLVVCLFVYLCLCFSPSKHGSILRMYISLNRRVGTSSFSTRGYNATPRSTFKLFSRFCYPEKLWLSVLLKGTSTDFSPSWLRDSNQQHFSYWPSTLNLQETYSTLNVPLYPTDTACYFLTRKHCSLVVEYRSALGKAANINSYSIVFH